MVALHSSDPATVHLSVLARQVERGHVPLETALYEDRSVVRHHAMRRTIWVMPIQTAIDAHAASTQRIATRERARTMKAFEWTPEFMDEANLRSVRASGVRRVLLRALPALDGVLHLRETAVTSLVDLE